jgi:prepilin-type N-terminal cleavage/methylation domain-containing protein
MTRRGLTLIEVVAATVLLVSLSVAAVTVIRDSRRVIEAAPDPPELLELAILADQIAARPASYGLDPATAKAGDIVFVTHDGGHIVVAIAAREVDHAWIRVEQDGVAIFRYVRVGVPP